MAMTSTEALRLKVKAFVEVADKDSLLEVERILKGSDDNMWWENLPEEVRTSVLVAMQEVEDGKGIPHSEVKNRYPQWFKR
ncbi:MAG: hypothetical protein EBZ77_07470 [Chitinophagia bacterium]|nr:hypothetical protein [Chitinophagia bacterium]